MRAAVNRFLDQLVAIEGTLELRDQLVLFGGRTPANPNVPAESLRHLLIQIGQRGLQPTLDGSILLLAAAFEQFIADAMITYCELLPTKVHEYSRLPKGVRSFNEQQTGEALLRRRPRFGPFKLESFVDNLRNCHLGFAPYVLNAEAIAAHDRNLTAGVLKDLFVRLGIGDIWDDVQPNSELVVWYGSNSREDAISFAKNDLNVFIDTRNRIAHSVGGQTPGPADVRRYLGFQRALAGSLIEGLEIRLDSL